MKFYKFFKTVWEVLRASKGQNDLAQMLDNQLLMESFFHPSRKNKYIREYLRRHPEK